MKKKIIVITAVIVLFAMAFSMAIPAVRNIRIDKMDGKITKSDSCVYSDEDIESAIETVKELYKAKEWPVVLMKIRFSEEDSKEKLTGYHLSETTEEENIIAVFCDYLVLKDFAAYSSGIYTGWSAILVRDNNTAQWEYVDGGYA